MWGKNSEISTLCCGSHITWKISHETAIPETAEAACTTYTENWNKYCRYKSNLRCIGSIGWYIFLDALNVGTDYFKHVLVHILPILVYEMKNH